MLLTKIALLHIIIKKQGGKYVQFIHLVANKLGVHKVFCECHFCNVTKHMNGLTFES